MVVMVFDELQGEQQEQVMRTKNTFLDFAPRFRVFRRASEAMPRRALSRSTSVRQSAGSSCRSVKSSGRSSCSTRSLGLAGSQRTVALKRALGRMVPGFCRRPAPTIEVESAGPSAAPSRRGSGVVVDTPVFTPCGGMWEGPLKRWAQRRASDSSCESEDDAPLVCDTPQGAFWEMPRRVSRRFSTPLLYTSTPQMTPTGRFDLPLLPPAPAPRAPSMPPRAATPAPVPTQNKHGRRTKAPIAAMPNEVTVCLRELPTEMTPAEVLAQLDGWRAHINFFYVPTNFESKLNLGIGFVNFVDRGAADAFSQQWVKRGGAEVGPARVQGWVANVDKLLCGSVLEGLSESQRPRVFQSGQEVAFPQLDEWRLMKVQLGCPEGPAPKKDAKQKDWTCPQCHANCFVSKRKCFKCGAAKPAA